MPAPGASSPLFGDVLARARLAWVRAMAERLGRLGYDDYRRTDAIVCRILLRGPVPIGRLGSALGVTRQAARKIVDGLEQRSHAVTERDGGDGRRLNTRLTPSGILYAHAVVDVIEDLNRVLTAQVDPAQLAIALSVLHQVIALGDGARLTSLAP